MENENRKEVYGNREDWLKARMRSIGGSDAPAVLNRSPWSTPLDIWLQKTGKDSGPAENANMKWGRWLEGAVSSAFHDDTGNEIIDPGDFTIYRHPDHDFMHATVDRFIRDSKDGLGILQIKTSFRKSDIWKEDDPPEHAMIQVQHEIACANVSFGALAVMIPGPNLRYWFVPRHDRFIDNMISKESEFWDLVRSETPPDIGDADLDTVKKLYSNFDGSSMVEIDDPGIIAADLRLQEIKSRIKELDEEKKRLEKSVRVAIGFNGSAVLPDGTVYRQITVNVPEAVRKAYSYARLIRRSPKGT